MELRCPNCATAQGAVDSSMPSPITCGGCGKSVYLPAEFPAIVAATYPSQQAPPIPLIPFFHIEKARTPPELGDGSANAAPATGEEQIDATSVNAALDDMPTAEIEGEAPVQMSVGMMQATTAVVSGSEDDDLPTVTPSGEESAELLSLASGSFAAALTPPPVAKASPDGLGEPTLSGMSTLGPPPWEGGPPPLKAAPPPVPPKLQSPVDELAAALGLPKLEEIAPIQQAPAAPSVAEEAAEEERKIARGGKRNMLIAGGVALLAGLIIAVIVARELTKNTEPPVDPKKPVVVVDSPSAASAPAEAKHDKPDTKGPAPLNPQKRAEAIEHYNKGNKLYLQRKYPEALAEYKRALESDSTFAYAHRGLGVTYASQRQNEKAIEAYKTYLQLAPDAKDAKQVKQIIANSEK